MPSIKYISSARFTYKVNNLQLAAQNFEKPKYKINIPVFFVSIMLF
jgi:hypothetical protein